MGPYIQLEMSSETWKLNIVKGQCFVLNAEIGERYVTSKCEVFKLILCNHNTKFHFQFVPHFYFLANNISILLSRVLCGCTVG